MIGVLIVSDVCLHRDGLAAMLDRQRTIRVLGKAARADDALARARSPTPAVILVDMAMPGRVPVLRALVREVPEAKVLVLAVPEEEEEVIASVEAGAAGCVARDASLRDVVSAVEDIARGDAPCPPSITTILFNRVRARAAEQMGEGLEDRLTQREREIVALIDEGLSNKQIAQRLCIEAVTVKNHVHNILQKLNVARRGEAAAAVRHRSGTAAHR